MSVYEWCYGRNVSSEFWEQWFIDNGRRFPWRVAGVSPFGILLVEMLLRQTRAEQVAGVWPDLFASYPTPSSLLQTSNDLFERVETLGFGNQRVEALLLASKHLVEKHEGEVPANRDELLKIPHVGLYSAHAVLCFAYGMRVPVVDTNVLRLFSRTTRH